MIKEFNIQDLYKDDGTFVPYLETRLPFLDSKIRNTIEEKLGPTHYSRVTRSPSTNCVSLHVFPFENFVAHVIQNLLLYGSPFVYFEVSYIFNYFKEERLKIFQDNGIRVVFGLTAMELVSFEWEWQTIL